MKVQNKIKFKQSASETSVLCKYLGLIIGFAIPRDYEYWEIYSILREIDSLVSSPRILKSEINVLENLIMRHNDLYVQYFGYLKPKMHFLIHIPTVINDNGPLVHFWSMANERKNKELQNIATATSSHRDLSQTIAIRIQLQQCYRKEVCDNLMSDICLGTVQNENDVEILLFDNEPPSTTTYNFITKYGKKYSPGTVIVTGYTDNEPIFSKIVQVYGTTNDIRFLISNIEFDIFCRHYYGFRIISISNVATKSIKLEEMLYYHGPCLVAQVKKTQYIATNYCVY